MILAFRILLIAALLTATFCESHADDLHVTVSGNDTATGTAGRPWKTIRHAISNCNPGDRIFVHEGTYRESLSFNRSGIDGERPTVLTNYSKDRVVLDGSGASNKDVSPMIAVKGKSNLTISGLEICNLKTTTLNETPIAILVSGACSNITIENCVIYDIANEAKLKRNLQGRDAHGIAVYGDDQKPITQLKIVGNLLRDLTLGSSEAIVVNGNVDGFEIRGNVVRDCDNIGIDCIGFEKVSPNPKTDQARNGIVAENRVFNVGTSQNPSYKGERSAAGIYVDGGTKIIVERNLVHHCDFGIEIASEHRGNVTDGISVRNNVLHHNVNAGLIIGGYNKSSTGDAADCKISNNTFFNNDTDVNGDEWGQIHLQHRVKNCSFTNNILVHDIAKNGCNLFVVQWPKSGNNIRFSHNQYFGSSTPVWVLKDDWIEGWDEYQQHEYSKDREAFANPKLAGPNKGNFGLQPDSPAVNSGDSATVSAEEADYEGRPRISGDSVDRGAFELTR